MSRQYMHDKHFSVAEAIQTLHQYHPMIEEITHLAGYLQSIGYDIYNPAYDITKSSNGGAFPKEMVRLVEIVRLLQKKGILLKGLEEGLVDFPHIRKNGEEVYLCYKLGEDTIQFWHPIQTGFAGRQPLDKL